MSKWREILSIILITIGVVLVLYNFDLAFPSLLGSTRKGSRSDFAIGGGLVAAGYLIRKVRSKDG